MPSFSLLPIGSLATSDTPIIGETPSEAIGTSVFDRQALSSTMVIASPFNLTSTILNSHSLTTGMFTAMTFSLGYESTTRFSTDTLLLECRTDNGSQYPSNTVFWSGSISLADTRISVSPSPGVPVDVAITTTPSTFGPVTLNTLFWVTVRTASGNPISTAPGGAFGSPLHVWSTEHPYGGASPPPSPFELIGTSLATLVPRGTGVGQLAGVTVAGLRIYFTVDQGVSPDVGLPQVIG